MPLKRRNRDMLVRCTVLNMIKDVTRNIAATKDTTSNAPRETVNGVRNLPADLAQYRILPIVTFRIHGARPACRSAMTADVHWFDCLRRLVATAYSGRASKRSRGDREGTVQNSGTVLIDASMHRREIS